MLNLKDYIIDSKLFKTINIDDLLFVKYSCLVEDSQSEIWAHENYLAYAIGGEKKWKTPESEFKIGSGEALFIKKGANTVYNYYDKPFYVLFVFLPDNFIRKVLDKHPDIISKATKRSYQNEQLCLLALNEVLSSFFNSLLAYFSEGVICSKEILRLKMEELVLNILTQPENHKLKQYFIRIGQSQQVDIEEMMQANYLRQLTLSEFARLCARSLSSFRRDFKKTFGTTPNRWLLSKRLEYSRFVLETTNKPIDEVIDVCGFKNCSHFIKAFKNVFGISPNRYRQRHFENET
ncbi:MAG: AraC family transcriptional regulator [Bacteroidota bacterium]